MDLAPHLLRRLFVAAAWVGVGSAMIPLARRKAVSAAAWPRNGLVAFTVPFPSIPYGPTCTATVLDELERALPRVRRVLELIPFFAAAGLLSGLVLLWLTLRRLGRLPDRTPLPSSGPTRTLPPS
jgi:hypothetical protein